MEKRHVQTFLMVSAAFFAMNLPAREAQASTLAQAVSHTLAQAGIGAAPAEVWAVSMGEAPAARTPIAQASHAHASTVQTASARTPRARKHANAA